MMNNKIWGQNVNSRRVRESVTSERPHGAEPDRASRNYHRLTIPKMYPNLPIKKKESFCHGLSDYYAIHVLMLCLCVPALLDSFDLGKILFLP
jgi:hypothetical protein